MAIISLPANMQLYPDILVDVQFADTEEAMTGDGVFADTDLIRIPYDGWLLVNCNAQDQVDGVVYVPQLNHQENRYNYLPIGLNSAGQYCNGQTLPWYKIKIFKGMTPRILYDETTDQKATFTGAFFKGFQNPVGLNTPDIIVINKVTATTQNMLAGTDLEDCPYPGYLLVWSSTADVGNSIQINQAGHQTGNTSEIPVIGVGASFDILNYPPYKTYVPATGNPTVTVNLPNDADVTEVLACFYVDWKNVPKGQLSRMGF